jgi:glycosyltransferase involved in cell wall biosynthesis
MKRGARPLPARRWAECRAAVAAPGPSLPKPVQHVRRLGPAIIEPIPSAVLDRPPLRVLQVTPRLAPHLGGVETHVREVASRLAAHHVESAILTVDETRRLPRRDELDGVPVMRAPAWPRHRDYLFAPEVFTGIRRGGWEVVHVQSYHTLVAPLAMAAAGRARIPYVVTFHGGGHSAWLRRAIRRPQLRLLRPLLARAKALISIADFEIEHYGTALGVPRGRFVTIPNGADLPAPSADAPPVSGRLIVSSGRLERYKGHERVLRALPYVLESVPDARLWIAGAGPQEAELRRLAGELGVADRVEIGPADRQGLADRLSRASLAVLLSEFESQPIAALEAASLGIPLVVADNSGLAELASRGLARAVDLANPPSAHARAMIEQLLHPLPGRDVPIPTWDACARDLASLYRAVAGCRRCAS